MFAQSFRAQVHTQDGKLLHIGHGKTAPEAFAAAWTYMKERLQQPLPPDMEVRILNDFYADALEPREIDEYRHAYTVCRTQAVVKRSKQDCQDCGFPDVPVETGYIRAYDTLGLLHMEDMMALLVANGPSVITSPPFVRQVSCECCDMLSTKGINPKTKKLSFTEGRV